MSASDSQPPARGALATIRRTVSAAPAQVADGFVRAVRNSPSERLDRLMHTPVRRVVLEAIFWQMPRYLDRKPAARINTSIRWHITGRSDGNTDVYHLVLADGRCRVIRGSEGPDPLVTITLEAAEFLRLAAGSSDPLQAYFSGRVKLAGNIMVEAKMTSLFRIPTPPPPPRNH